MIQLSELALQAQRIVDSIHPLLAGKDPDVQGAVLADLVACYLAGHRPVEFREELFQLHITTVRGLIIHYDRKLYGDS